MLNYENRLRFSTILARNTFTLEEPSSPDKTRSGGDTVRKSGLPTHGTGSGGDTVRKSGLSTHGTRPGEERWGINRRHSKIRNPKNYLH